MKRTVICRHGRFPVSQDGPRGAVPRCGGGRRAGRGLRRWRVPPARAAGPARRDARDAPADAAARGRAGFPRLARKVPGPDRLRPPRGRLRHWARPGRRVHGANRQLGGLFPLRLDCGGAGGCVVGVPRQAADRRGVARGAARTHHARAQGRRWRRCAPLRAALRPQRPCAVHGLPVQEGRRHADLVQEALVRVPGRDALLPGGPLFDRGQGLDPDGRQRDPPAPRPLAARFRAGRGGGRRQARLPAARRVGRGARELPRRRRDLYGAARQVDRRRRAAGAAPARRCTHAGPVPRVRRQDGRRRAQAELGQDRVPGPARVRRRARAGRAAEARRAPAARARDDAYALRRLHRRGQDQQHGTQRRARRPARPHGARRRRALRRGPPAARVALLPAVPRASPGRRRRRERHQQDDRAEPRHRLRAQPPPPAG